MKMSFKWHHVTLAAGLLLAVPAGAAPGEKYPQTQTRVLRTSEVAKMSPSQRQYAINEIYARHGLLFGEMKLRKQFLQFDWYKPEPGLTSAQARKQFNSYEKRNIERLALARELEKERVEADVQALPPYKSPYKPGSKGLARERFPETRLDDLDAEDAAAMTDSQLQYAINEIYARHGFNFGEMATRKHFLGIGWYKPKPQFSMEEIASMTFSKRERANVDILAAERAARRSGQAH